VSDSVQIVVDKLTDDEANIILCAVTESLGEDELAAVKEVRVLCRNHALAVSMAASMKQEELCSWAEISEELRDHMSEVSWSEDKADLYNRNYKGLLECIDLSVRHLSADQRLWYDALVVLPEDVWMPQALLQEYWGITRMKTKRVVVQLQRRSLIEVNCTSAGGETVCRIKPHDLQRDYLLSKAAADPKALAHRHAVLIASFQCEHVISGKYLDDAAQQLLSTVGPMSRYASAHFMEHFKAAAGEQITRELPWKTLNLNGVYARAGIQMELPVLTLANYDPWLGVECLTLRVA
jgi:hypothetical protein